MNDVKISQNKRLIIAISLFILYVGALLSYNIVISDSFAYMGFLNELSFIKLFFCTILTIILCIICFFVKKSYFNIIYVFTFIFFYIGIVIIYQFENSASFVPTFVISFVLLLLKFSDCRQMISLAPKKIIKNKFLILMVVTTLLFIPFLIYLPHINIKNLFFIDVYKTRTLFAQISITALDYLKAPLSRVALPVLIVWCLEKRQKKVGLFVLMIIYIYLCGALKSIFFGLISLIFFYKGDYFKKIMLMILFFVGCSYVGLLMYGLFDSVLLIDLPIRRVLIVPGELTSDYWLYFKDNLTFLSHSPFGLGLVEYKYPLDIIHYFGEYVIGKPGHSPNVGIITEGLFSFGAFGGIVFGVIYIAIMNFFYRVNIQPKYFGILFVYIYYLNTSLLSTLLLTHGLLFFMAFAYFFLCEPKINIVEG